MFLSANPWDYLSDVSMKVNSKNRFFVNIMSDISGIFMTIGIGGFLITVSYLLIRLGLPFGKNKFSEWKDSITWKIGLLLFLFMASFILGLAKKLLETLM